jgi:hypothetical protein
MRRFAKVFFSTALMALFSTAAVAAGIISINVTGEGGTPSDAIEAAYDNGKFECEEYFDGIATGYQIVTLSPYPGFWWAELNVSCYVP